MKNAKIVGNFWAKNNKNLENSQKCIFGKIFEHLYENRKNLGKTKIFRKKGFQIKISSKCTKLKNCAKNQIYGF